MVYDCFIFNDELELLKIRLRYMDSMVDKFVLVESERTLSGNKKELHYENNQHLYKKYADKIIHLIAPVNELSIWEYEFFQRNYIKEALKNCSPEDIIFITDVDELLNISGVFSKKELILPSLIEIDMFYYFLNVKTNNNWIFPLICQWKQIENIHIGSRVTYEKNITQNILTQDGVNNGWHFSYLYGNNIKLYQNKIKTFSHQEFNKLYFLDEKRIRKCIDFSIDIFERPEVRLTQSDNHLKLLEGYIKDTPFEKLIYSQPTVNKYLQPSNFYFVVYNKIYKRGKYLLRNFMKEIYHKLK